MKIEIDFNRHKDDFLATKGFFEHIGAKLHDENEYCFYYVEINSLEELEELYYKINLFLSGGKCNFGYSFVMNFDPVTIYLDKEV